MQMVPTTKLKITLLGGTPTGRKAQWLRGQLNDGVFEDAFVILSELPLAAIAESSDARRAQATVLPKGCACCGTRAELIAVLRRRCCDPEGVVHGDERIVLEVGETADLGLIASAVQSDRILSGAVLIGELIVTVDASVGKELRDQPLLCRQIEVADCVMILDLDDVDQRGRQEFLVEVCGLNPHVPIYDATTGKIVILPEADAAKLDGVPVGQAVSP